MLDVLAGDADIVGDLVDLMALFSPGQDAGAAQAVNGRMVGIVGSMSQSYFLTRPETHSLRRRQMARPSGVSASHRPQRARRPSGVYCAAFGE
jgi:hypothetical protein